MRMIEKRVSLVVAGAAVLFALTIGFFAALGVRSAFGRLELAPAASAPNPGHEWSQIGLPAGTWTGLDADTLDGLDSNQIQDADDQVSYATSAGSATYATSAGSASSCSVANFASSAGDADTLDGLHANQIHDADDYVSNAGDADTVDGKHASELEDSLVCGTASHTEWVGTGPTCVMSPVLSAAFQLTGGGCQYQTYGGAYKLLYESWPITWNRWVCCFKDHVTSDTGWITATVIGCKTQ